MCTLYDVHALGFHTDVDCYPFKIILILFKSRFQPNVDAILKGLGEKRKSSHRFGIFAGFTPYLFLGECDVFYCLQGEILKNEFNFPSTGS